MPTSNMMNIVNEVQREYDAFVPMEVDAEVITRDDIFLEGYVLNADLAEDMLGFAEELLTSVNYIHCRAFGVPTSITFDGNKFTHPPFTPIEPNAKIDPRLEPELLLLVQRKDGKDKIIMMAMVSFSTFLHSKRLDIWSVAKNPKVQFANAFEVFLTKLKDFDTKDYYNAIKYYNLVVGQDNTYRMTEQGRLRLYCSLGFRLIQGTHVRLNYPNEPFVVVKHSPQQPEYVYLKHAETDALRCVFLGALTTRQEKAVVTVETAEDHPMMLQAPRSALGTKIDIYGGFGECFKGKEWLSYDQEEDKLVPVKGGIEDNSKVLISDKPENYTFYRSSYHMGLVEKPVVERPGNTFVDSFKVPDDFIICTISSPGSHLWTNSTEQTKFVTEIIKTFLDNAENMNTFINVNRSTAKLPIYNIQTHSSYADVISKEAELYKYGGVNKACSNQIKSTLLNSIIVESLGRQPIFEFPLNVPTTKQKKYQLDLQVYVPGMQMFNLQLSRQSPTRTGGRDCLDEDQAKLDNDTLNLGTFSIHTDFNFVRIADDRFVNQYPPENNLEAYLKEFRKWNPLPKTTPPSKYFLFMFGCAGVETQENYELLYELSHRRSIVYTFPLGSGMSTNDFINSAIYNKLKDPYEEVCVDPGSTMLGGRRKAKRKVGMATRFKKLRTRKMKGRNALKTRKYKGGNQFTNALKGLAATVTGRTRSLSNASTESAGTRNRVSSNASTASVPNAASVGSKDSSLSRFSSRSAASSGKSQASFANIFAKNRLTQERQAAEKSLRNEATRRHRAAVLQDPKLSNSTIGAVFGAENTQQRSLIHKYDQELQEMLRNINDVQNIKFNFQINAARNSFRSIIIRLNQIKTELTAALGSIQQKIQNKTPLTGTEKELLKVYAFVHFMELSLRQTLHKETHKTEIRGPPTPLQKFLRETSADISADDLALAELTNDILGKGWYDPEVYVGEAFYKKHQFHPQDPKILDFIAHWWNKNTQNFKE